MAQTHPNYIFPHSVQSPTLEFFGEEFVRSFAFANLLSHTYEPKLNLKGKILRKLGKQK